MPAGLVKARPQNELHRRGQRKLRPGGQHPVQAKQRTEHGQHQRRRQGQAHGDAVKPRPGRSVLVRGHGLGGALQQMPTVEAENDILLLSRKVGQFNHAGRRVTDGEVAGLPLARHVKRTVPAPRWRKIKQRAGGDAGGVAQDIGNHPHQL